MKILVVLFVLMISLGASRAWGNCPRIHCTDCFWGRVLDVNGCPTDECQERPDYRFPGQMVEMSSAPQVGGIFTISKLLVPIGLTFVLIGS